MVLLTAADRLANSKNPQVRRSWERYRPILYLAQDYRGDVWLLTERDAGTRIDGSRNDLFVFRLEEHSGGGYLWNIDQLKASGFGIVRDELEATDGEGFVGPVIR